MKQKPTLSGGQIRKLAKNAVALAFGGIAAQAAFVLIEALIARRLSQELYGVFSTVFVLVMLSVWVVDAGIGWKLVQDGSRRAAEIPRLLGTGLALRLMIFLTLYPLAVLAVAALGYGPGVTSLFVIFYCYALVMVVQDSLVSVYAAQQRMEINAFYQGITPLVICGFAWFLVGADEGINRVGWAYVAGGALVTLVWSAITFRRVRPRLDVRGMPAVLKGSYQYGLTGLLGMAFQRIDLLLLSLLREMSEVGIYAAGAKLLDLAFKIPVLASRVAAPLLFQKSHDDPPGYRALCYAMLRAAAAMALFIAILFGLLAEPLILFVFGEKYHESIVILQVLGAGFAMRFLNTALQLVLSTSDLHARRTRSLAFATAVNVGAALLLIPPFGIAGAAASAVLAQLVLFVVFLLGVRGVLPPRPLLRPLGLAVLCAAPAYLTASFLLDTPLLSWLLASALYAVLLGITGYFTRAELGYLIQSVLRRT